MSVPKHLWRFPTREAIESLANQFDLPNRPDMQDWEWEVADPLRIDEFMSVYESGALSDDERFVLMEILLQSFANLDTSLQDDPRWARTLQWLDANVDLHAHSIWYWSVLDSDPDQHDAWPVTPFVRSIREKHRDRLDPKGGS